MEEDDKKLQIVMFPWLAFGHIIPFLELAKRLALQGHRISFVSTPRNLQRLPEIPQNLAPLISLVSLPLPRYENLPPDAETTTDVPSDQVEFLKKAYDCLQEPMAAFLEVSCPVDWIIYDFSNYWLPPIADRFGIRKVFFSTFNAWSLSAFGPSSNMINDGGGTWTKPESLTKPFEWIPFPNNLMYMLHEAKKSLGLAQKNASGVSDMFRCGSSIHGCDVLAVRSCVELEAEYLQLLEKLNGKPVLPVGLLPISVEENQGAQEDTWHSINGWLNQQKNESVIYVALGTEVNLSQEQITELALGLELSQMPFFWALQKPREGSVELPDGFEERTKGHGLVWTSWAPQPRILAHASIGGFLTHCGWSSIIEGFQFGRPLIMLPFVLDQGPNARVLAAKKVGIEIPRKDDDGSFTRSSVAEPLQVLLKDEAGYNYKDEAKKMSRIVADQNLQKQYFENFQEHLCNLKPVH